MVPLLVIEPSTPAPPSVLRKDTLEPVIVTEPWFTRAASRVVFSPTSRLSVPVMFKDPVPSTDPLFQFIVPSTISSLSTAKMPYELRFRLEEPSTRDCSCIPKVPSLIARLAPFWRNNALTVSVYSMSCVTACMLISTMSVAAGTLLLSQIPELLQSPVSTALLSKVGGVTTMS